MGSGLGADTTHLGSKHNSTKGVMHMREPADLSGCSLCRRRPRSSLLFWNAMGVVRLGHCCKHQLQLPWHPRDVLEKGPHKGWQLSSIRVDPKLREDLTENLLHARDGEGTQVHGLYSCTSHTTKFA